MSRKHFKLLAEALKRMKPSQADIELLRGEYNQWCSDVQAVASACAESNNNFDRGTFYAACEYNRDRG